MKPKAELISEVVRLEAALAALKAPGSKVVPPLEIPARWKKSSTLKER